MKKLLLLVTLFTLMGGANSVMAGSTIIKEVDFSNGGTVGWSPDTKDGWSYEISEGVLVIDNTKVQTNNYDLQLFIANNFNTRVGYNYTIKVTLKANGNGSAYLATAAWGGSNMGKQLNFSSGNSFTEYSISYDAAEDVSQTNAHVLWQSGEFKGTVQISKVQVIESSEYHDALSALITKAQMYNAYAYTEASFDELTSEITTAQSVLVDESSTQEQLTTAKDNLQAKIDALELKGGYSNLTSDMYKEWTSGGADATETGEPAYGDFHLFESTGMPYGNGNVPYNWYANLSSYDKLVLVVYTGGTPRFLLNRDIDNGSWNETEAESHLIDNTKDGWSAKYFSYEDQDGVRIWTVDLAQLINDKGFAHLHTIKQVGAQVTVSGMYLFKLDDLKTALSAKIEEANNKSSVGKTTESYTALTEAKDDAVSALEAVDATEESLSTAMTNLQNAIDGLTLAEGYVNLTTEVYHEWSGIGEDATIVGNGARVLNLNTSLGGGGVLYGDVNVNYKHYAKLKNPKNLIFIGTPGLELGVRTDRPETGDPIQLNVTLDNKGVGIVDLSDYTSIRINAIKRSWGGSAGVVTELFVEYKPIPVEVSAAGYATYVNSDHDLDFSETSIEAYKVKVNSKGVATLTKVNQVPAGTPVLLYKDGGATEGIPVMTDADAVSDNDLVAGTGAAVATTDGDYTNMILNVVDDKIGFYFAAGQTVAANRAYLHIASTLAPDAVGSGPARGMRLVFDGAITGVETVEASVETAQKDGKFFKDGKLFIMKNGVKYNAAGAQIK